VKCGKKKKKREKEKKKKRKVRRVSLRGEPEKDLIKIIKT